ncbi:MAG: hypothetical protein ITG02_01265 [Patulibacter sp.]|nr:hypothetical protein [Patulibacter sp.]
MLTTWILIGAAATVAWTGRKPVAALLWDGVARFRRPRQLELVVPPRLDRWAELDAPARDGGVEW